MSAVSLFDTLKSFENDFVEMKPRIIKAGTRGKEDFKYTLAVNTQVEALNKKVQKWKDRGDSKLPGLRDLLHRPWVKIATFKIGEKLFPFNPPKSADAPYEFGKLDKAEMSSLKKKATFLNTIAKTCLVTGIILVSGGLIVPLALATLLFTLPQSIILGTIIAATVLGVAGVASAVAYPIIKNTKPLNEYEAETNKEYQRFINEIVQNSDKPFNLSRQEIQKGGTLKVYRDYRESLENLFTKKVLKNLKKESAKK